MQASVSTELESARPQTIGEEELQLQLALAMSREEADQEEQRKRSDDVRLQLALSQSQEDSKDGEASAWPTSPRCVPCIQFSDLLLTGDVLFQCHYPAESHA
jgi:epsin